jgi:hypothetical protein
MRVLALCVLVAGPAVAQGVPDASYFAGRYEVTGRDAKGPVDEIWRLTGQGQDVKVERCAGGAPGTMVVDQSGEGSFATITLGERELECQWFNTWDNYPLIACYDDANTRLTLWPVNEIDGCEK